MKHEEYRFEGDIAAQFPGIILDQAIESRRVVAILSHPGDMIVRQLLAAAPNPYKPSVTMPDFLTLGHETCPFEKAATMTVLGNVIAFPTSTAIQQGWLLVFTEPA